MLGVVDVPGALVEGGVVGVVGVVVCANAGVPANKATVRTWVNFFLMISSFNSVHCISIPPWRCCLINASDAASFPFIGRLKSFH